MIDIENLLIKNIDTNLALEFTKYTLNPESDEFEPTQFPIITVRESNSMTYGRTVTGFNEENHDDKMYTIEVFTNDKSGKRNKAKAIFKNIDTTMLALGFSRIFLEPIPNYLEATIYRMTGRYVGVVSQDYTVHGR